MHWFKKSNALIIIRQFIKTVNQCILMAVKCLKSMHWKPYRKWNINVLMMKKQCIDDEKTMYWYWPTRTRPPISMHWFPTHQEINALKPWPHQAYQCIDKKKTMSTPIFNTLKWQPQKYQCMDKIITMHWYWPTRTRLPISMHWYSTAPKLGCQITLKFIADFYPWMKAKKYIPYLPRIHTNRIV